MIPHAITTALHAIGFMTLFGVLVAQHLAVNDTESAARISRLRHLQWIHLAAWLFLLATGIVLGAVLMPVQLYLQNGLFHLKFTLVLLLLPLWAAFSWLLKRSHPDSPMPPLGVWILRIQLLIIALIPFLATFMARGFGYFGGQ